MTPDQFQGVAAGSEMYIILLEILHYKRSKSVYQEKSMINKITKHLVCFQTSWA